MTAFSISQGIDFFSAPAVPAAPEGAPEFLHEQRLIAGARAGDTEAFRQLVEWHQPMILRLCTHWLQCGEDASEACQDTFLKAWQALPAWEPRGRLTTWLYQIALNQCRDRARSRAARCRRVTVPLSGIPATPACPQPSPDLAAARSSDLEKLQRGLARLPDGLRTPLILCAIEGLSHREAAAVLHCSPRAVEGRLYRARQQLLDWWHHHAGT